MARATENERLKFEYEQLREKAGPSDELTGTSAAINNVRATLKRDKAAKKARRLGDDVEFESDEPAMAGEMTVTVTFELAGGVDLTDGYRLSVAGQATINPDEVSVRVGTTTGTITGVAGSVGRDTSRSIQERQPR